MPRIAISTGGGDAPGLNAVIRAVTLSAKKIGWDVYGIRRGYTGLLDTTQIMELTIERVSGIAHLGGTILGTQNKGHPFEYPSTGPDGKTKLEDRSLEVMQNFKRMKFDAFISVGGDGSLRIAKRFSEMGMPVVGVPKTIDNDLAATAATFGFDTAVNTATEAIDKLHSTAQAHSRVMVVELMGRYAGWIALNSGVAAGAHVILLPEIPFNIEKVCQAVRDRESRGRVHSIVVVAEGAKPENGSLFTHGKDEPGRETRLGGVSAWVAEEIEKRTRKETRSLVLGHIQRGGPPTPFDRLLALRFGSAAVEAILEEKFGCMVALNPPRVNLVPFEEALAKIKLVPLDCDTVATARRLGIRFGD